MEVFSQRLEQEHGTQVCACVCVCVVCVCVVLCVCVVCVVFCVGSGQEPFVCWGRSKLLFSVLSHPHTLSPPFLLPFPSSSHTSVSLCPPPDAAHITERVVSESDEGRECGGHADAVELPDS